MAKRIRSRNFESACNLRVRLDFFFFFKYIQGRREGMLLNSKFVKEPALIS